jgi:hypothetical protein
MLIRHYNISDSLFHNTENLTKRNIAFCFLSNFWDLENKEWPSVMICVGQLWFMYVFWMQSLEATPFPLKSVLIGRFWTTNYIVVHQSLYLGKELQCSMRSPVLFTLVFCLGNVWNRQTSLRTKVCLPGPNVPKTNDFIRWNYNPDLKNDRMRWQNQLK